MWLGQNSSQGKQRRLLGELHTRMTASGNAAVDRLALRKDYLPSLRRTLVAPLVEREKDGIEDVVQQMQARFPSQTMQFGLPSSTQYCMIAQAHFFVQPQSEWLRW